MLLAEGQIFMVFEPIHIRTAHTVFSGNSAAVIIKFCFLCFCNLPTNPST
jgi:hypothetical protein